MKKKWLALIATAVTLLVIGLALRTRMFYKEQRFSELEIQWNDHEIFVFVDESTIYRSQSIARFLSMGASGAEETFVQNGLWVVHAREGRTQKRYMDLGQRRGPIGPVQGVPHMFLGGGSRRVLRWSGNDFKEVSAESARRIGSSFGLISELLQREGWSRASGLEIGDLGDYSTASRTINLQDDAIRVTIRPMELPKRLLTLESDRSEPVEVNVGLPRTEIDESEFERAKVKSP